MVEAAGGRVSGCNVFALACGELAYNVRLRGPSRAVRHSSAAAAPPNVVVQGERSGVDVRSCVPVVQRLALVAGATQASVVGMCGYRCA